MVFYCNLESIKNSKSNSSNVAYWMSFNSISLYNVRHFFFIWTVIRRIRHNRLPSLLDRWSLCPFNCSFYSRKQRGIKCNLVSFWDKQQLTFGSSFISHANRSQSVWNCFPKDQDVILQVKCYIPKLTQLWKLINLVYCSRFYLSLMQDREPFFVGIFGKNLVRMIKLLQSGEIVSNLVKMVLECFANFFCTG